MWLTGIMTRCLCSKLQGKLLFYIASFGEETEFKICYFLLIYFPVQRKRFSGHDLVQFSKPEMQIFIKSA